MITTYSLFKTLLKIYGPQHWWPIDKEYHKKFNTDWRVEVIIGAILTQCTNWKNVEKALNNFKSKNLLFDIEYLLNTDRKVLETVFKPVNFYKTKVDRVLNFFNYVKNNYDSNLDLLFSKPLLRLREEILSIKGIGKETCDVILLYAGNKPIFPVDKYTIRLFNRLKLSESKNYEQIRKLVESKFNKKVKNENELVKIYKEYHALIDIHCKTTCKKEPICKKCIFKEHCKYLIKH